MSEVIFCIARQRVFDLVFTVLTLDLVWFWAPLVAFLLRRHQETIRYSGMEPRQRMILLASCHNGEACLPQFMECMTSQNYPRDLYRIVVIADNCTDNSARRAWELGADEVYVRKNLELRGKGYALDEYFKNSLRHRTFDRLLLFDIDAWIDDEFLNKAVSYASETPVILQGSTVSKNPDESPLTRIGDLIQSLIRVHQGGRSALGLSPIMIGSHGICINRAALERLGWQIAPKGRDGDDLELGLRSLIRGIAILYAPDLRVKNDLPIAGQAIRLQRRRWTRSAVQLTRHYALPLFRRGIRGDWKMWDGLIGLLLLPSFSNFLLLATAAFSLAWLTAPGFPNMDRAAVAAGSIWISYVTFLLLALRASGAVLEWSDFKSIPQYLFFRAMASFESFIFAASKEWWPTMHPGDRRPCVTDAQAGGDS